MPKTFGTLVLLMSGFTAFTHWLADAPADQLPFDLFGHLLPLCVGWSIGYLSRNKDQPR
jgi:hypothetical protein